MQLPTRVFIVADTDAEARKLVQFFRESPGFAVAGFGVADRLPRLRDDVDVILIHSTELGRTPALRQATVPILYLVDETRTLRLDRRNAVLSQNASPAQIRAAAAALAVGLHVESNSVTALHSDDGADFTFQEALTDREIDVLNLI